MASEPYGRSRTRLLAYPPDHDKLRAIGQFALAERAARRTGFYHPGLVQELGLEFDTSRKIRYTTIADRPPKLARTPADMYAPQSDADPTIRFRIELWGIDVHPETPGDFPRWRARDGQTGEIQTLCRLLRGEVHCLALPVYVRLDWPLKCTSAECWSIHALGQVPPSQAEHRFIDQARKILAKVPRRGRRPGSDPDPYPDFPSRVQFLYWQHFDKTGERPSQACVAAMYGVSLPTFQRLRKTYRRQMSYPPPRPEFLDIV